MNIKLYIFIFIGMIFSFGNMEVIGQNLNLDSLFIILEGPFEESEKGVAELKNLAIEYLFSNPSFSQRFSRKGLGISERIGYKKGIADTYRLQGVAEAIRRNNTNALTYYFKARDVFIEMNDSSGIARVLMNIGTTYSHPDDQEKAFDYLYQSIEINKKINSMENLGKAYNNIGTIYWRSGHLDSALAYNNRSLVIKREMNDSLGMGAGYSNQGLIYEDLGEYDLALEHYRISQKISIKIGNFVEQTRSYLNIGKVLTLKNSYELAEYNYNQALHFADSIDLKAVKSDCLEGLSILEEKRGNYKAAYNYFRQYMDSKIIILTDQKSIEIEQLEVSFQIREKDAELNLANQELLTLRNENKFQQLLNYLRIIGTVLILIIGYIIIRFQKSKLKEADQLKEAQEKINKSERENARLREKGLKSDLYFKNKELTSFTISFMKRNELLDELKSITGSIIDSMKQNRASDHVLDKLNKLKRTITNNITADKDWEDFKLYFEKVHQDFFTALKNNFPGLTNSDLKLCSLSRLNFNIKETANILGVSPDSIKKARYRLRKKLNMEPEADLLKFLMKIEENAENLLQQI